VDVESLLRSLPEFVPVNQLGVLRRMFKRRGRAYHARSFIPADLRDVVIWSEVCRMLRTVDYSAVKIRAAHWPYPRGTGHLPRLQRRGGTCYFRVKIPLDLREAYRRPCDDPRHPGKLRTELRVALGTAELDEACSRRKGIAY
jgi:hypothetical protein